MSSACFQTYCTSQRNSEKLVSIVWFPLSVEFLLGAITGVVSLCEQILPTFLFSKTEHLPPRRRLQERQVTVRKQLATPLAMQPTISVEKLGEHKLQPGKSARKLFTPQEPY